MCGFLGTRRGRCHLCTACLLKLRQHKKSALDLSFNGYFCLLSAKISINDDGSRYYGGTLLQLYLNNRAAQSR